MKDQAAAAAVALLIESHVGKLEISSAIQLFHIILKTF